MANVIVRGIKRYSFEDRSTGRTVQGMNVFFEEVNQENSADAKGFQPKKAGLPLDDYSLYESMQFPFEAEVIIDTVFTGRGAQAKVVAFKPVDNLKK